LKIDLDKKRTKGGFSIFCRCTSVAVGVALLFFSGGTSLGLSSVGLALVWEPELAQEELYFHGLLNKLIGIKPQ
jgi:hypothetical protein